MSRWAQEFDGDSPARVDGDRGWIRMRSRLDAGRLERGELERAENLRLDRGTLLCRKGAKRLNEEFAGIVPPLTLDFELGHEVDISSITRSGSTATVTTAVAHGFETGEKIAIDGADQAEYNGDFFITVTGADEFTYEVSGTPATPATGDDMIAGNGPVLEEVYDDGVRAAGVFSNPNEDFEEYIALAAGTQLFLLREGEAITAVPYPTNETIAVDEEASVVDANSELYVFREGKQPLKWDGDSAEMELVPGSLSSFTLSSLTQTGGTATATTAVDHNFETGDMVTIEGANEADYNGTHEVTVTGADTFTFDVDSGASSPATGTITASRDAFRGIPRAPWALWFANRMFVPFGPGTGAANSRDEFVVSDIFDPANYDMIAGHFRVNIGTSDYLVGLHPYQDDSVLVFMRKSIHLVSGIAGDLSDARVTEITREVGCIARRSIVTAGRFVFFLSDQGVYVLEIGHELKLRGAMRPLSDGIQDLMREIPLERAQNAAGVFWDNRYYLAVPSGAIAGEGPARNDRVLVFNVLNDGWESLDVYPESLWLDWLVLSFWGGSRRIFGANEESFIYLLDEIDGHDEVGMPGSETGAEAAIRGFARTRVWDAEAPGVLKLWLRLQADLVSPDAAVNVRAVGRGPDGAGPWQAMGANAARVRRLPLRRRGEGLQAEVEFPAGKGEVHALYAEGVETGRSMVRY